MHNLQISSQNINIGTKTIINCKFTIYYCFYNNNSIIFARKHNQKNNVLLVKEKKIILQIPTIDNLLAMDPVRNTKDEKSINKITKKEVMNLLSINKIPIKDEDYVKEHLIIEKKSKTDYYEIKVTDIDESTYVFQIELKTYP
ncbi:hypothetical protein [Sphingobacterium gobiense]|uniref:Uncharacterized protein n=1 Tax=Sphingobacterium gobiense TaxID=1382456 RepID=A0A2S9JUN3_9SPHI|nr:hypothetical protein [Sphingobacterium gobiense]PRD56985.1 hypothetical protein C5749_07190 [Sphingobacterium gobiense]